MWRSKVLKWLWHGHHRRWLALFALEFSIRHNFSWWVPWWGIPLGQHSHMFCDERYVFLCIVVSPAKLSINPFSDSRICITLGHLQSDWFCSLCHRWFTLRMRSWLTAPGFSTFSWIVWSNIFVRNQLKVPVKSWIGNGWVFLFNDTR